MGYLTQQKRIQIKDLKIEQGDRSQRLDQEELGRAWAVDYSDNFQDILPWFKQDKVIQQILNFKSLSPLVQPFIHCNDFADLITPPFSDVAMRHKETTPLTTSDYPVHMVEESTGQMHPKNNSQNHWNHQLSAQQSLHQYLKAKSVQSSCWMKALSARRSTIKNVKIQKNAWRPAMGI